MPRPPLDLESPDFLPCQCTAENPCKEDSTCVNRAIHSECSPKTCPAGDLCQNQRMQKCQNAHTELFFTGNRGWGLKAAADLSAGDFVIEYVGEVLDEEMCRDRLKRAHSQNNNNFYMLTLDAGLVIDAGRKSNHARFINHSCSPNCETQKWRARGEPRIGIFARENIRAGTELTFDYHLDSLGNEKKRCFCGSKNCSGFLGLRSLKVVSEEDAKTKPKPKKKKKAKARPVSKKDGGPGGEEREMAIGGAEGEGEVEDRHDDECFICRDGGELLLCDRKTCSRAYHLECINRKVVPPKSRKWECPWHFCSKCQKSAVSFCSACPVSFCSKHLKSNLCKQEDSNVLLCRTCQEQDLKPLGSGGDSGGLGHGVEPEGPSVRKLEGETSASLQVSQAKQEEGEEEVVEEVKTEEKASSSKKLFRPLEAGLSPRPPSAGVLGSPAAGCRLSPPLAVSIPLPRKATPEVQLGTALSPSSDSGRSLMKSPPLPPPTSMVSLLPITGLSSGGVGMEGPQHQQHSKGSSEPQAPQFPRPPTTAATTTSADPHRSPPAPSAFRSCLTTTNRTAAPLFQPQSPTFGQGYPVPIPESHSAKLPEGYVDLSGTRVAAAAPSFQPSQQSPMCINPVWLMQRNGLVNGLDPASAAAAAAAASGFSYPSYPSALINHASPIGFPYPTAGYFGADPALSNLESFNVGGMHHHHHHHHAGHHPHHQLSSSTATASSVSAPTAAAAAAAAAAAVGAPTSSSFPAAVFPQTPHQQSTFLTWKYY